MPDWKQKVRKNLRLLAACSPEFAEQVTEELSGHLEDIYEDRLQTGMMEEAALECALNEAKYCRGNWLAVRLLKEDCMTGFTRKIGLPGLVTFAVAMVIAYTLEALHIPPKIIFFRDSLFLSLPIAWMCALPVCGVLGAILSRRNGGSRLDRMISASFPAAMFGVVFAFVFIVGCVVSLFVRGYWEWRFVAWGILLWWTGYVVLPAIPLILGATVADQIKRVRGQAA
jgi:hypothetical protein